MIMIDFSHRNPKYPMPPYDYCELGMHPMKSFQGYVYSDDTHGITKEISVCRECYNKHILEYYPDSLMAEYIRREAQP